MTWTRSAQSMGVCACDHLEAEHRQDLKRMRCGRYGCDCPDYDIAALAWTERRTVIEPLES